MQLELLEAGARGDSVSEALDMLAKQVDDLESKLHSDTRTSINCSICCERPFVWVFSCGHAK